MLVSAVPDRDPVSVAHSPGPFGWAGMELGGSRGCCMLLAGPRPLFVLRCAGVTCSLLLFVQGTLYVCTCDLGKYEVQATAVYVGMLGLAKGRARRPMICSNVQVDSEYSCSLYVHILVL